MSSDIVLKADRLHTVFEVKSQHQEKALLRAVNDVSLTIREGDVLGVVGESGCGKSTLGRTILRLEEKAAGEVFYRGTDIFSLHHKELKQYRKKMQMIFQDPSSSLNPRKKVISLLKQPYRIHKIGSDAEIQERVENLMQEVGLNPRHQRRFSHQFSGGQRQRIGIARALALNPEFIVCDEAVSALDVSVQAQILNLLLDLQQRHKLTYMFISHDLSVVEFISTRIMVMYLGKIVELTDKAELMANPLHPYTKTLFAAYPVNDPSKREQKKRVVMGDVPSPINPPAGCHFHPRCPFKMPICEEKYPEIVEAAPGHHVACHLFST
ncbi:ABC transporter ATP-binding protein [Marispirochaeta sp.]|uniref:ABC transporter ATP-binding protein n=1 Tax=Marispirochaeta sp. TaxID=2038653 RepID=UPI0029C76526|nr:ABC transporter ATP-binding protein [Marispirochaeta sp.]